MTTSHKRQFSRITFTRKVSLTFVGAEYNFCDLKDLNLTGMFVFGAFKQKAGDPCFVDLHQKGATTDLSLHATARVVWTNDSGIAIQFNTMAIDSYMFLQTTLLYEAEDPLSIGLELPPDCPFVVIEPDENEDTSGVFKGIRETFN